MSYITGLICADGAVEDVRKSSRTCYFTITSKDKSLILQVKRVLNSSHNIYIVNERMQRFGSNLYKCSKEYVLRIGSKEMCQDLINLGITPRKSLRLFLPSVPQHLFGFYLRGYFDGDGCINIYNPKGLKKPDISVIFTSGCKRFLEKLSLKIKNNNGTKGSCVYLNSRAYRLKYGERRAIRVLDFMYKDLKDAPYLKRKYVIYTKSLKLPHLA